MIDQLLAHRAAACVRGDWSLVAECDHQLARCGYRPPAPAPAPEVPARRRRRPPVASAAPEPDVDATEPVCAAQSDDDGRALAGPLERAVPPRAERAVMSDREW